MTIKCQDCQKSTSSPNEVCGECFENRILVALDRRGEMTRGEMMRYMGVARSTLYDALVRLETKWLIDRKSIPIRRGRPKTVWSRREVKT
jgi:predicted ArsR family transcriptional regulator